MTTHKFPKPRSATFMAHRYADRWYEILEVGAKTHAEDICANFVPHFGTLGLRPGESRRVRVTIECIGPIKQENSQ